MIGVYKITSPTGKIYIGSSINIERRFNDYKLLKTKQQTRLHASFLKHGFNAHVFEVLMECSKDDLLKNEHIYSLQHDVLGKNGLNCEIPGYGEVKGVFSEVTREKIRHAAKNISDETRKKMSESAKRKPFASPELRKKRAELSRNRVIKDSTRIKLSFINKGKRPHVNCIMASMLKLKGSVPPNAKTVLNTETGIYYDSATRAAKAAGFKSSTLRAMLIGQNRNYTMFKYV